MENGTTGRSGEELIVRAWLHGRTITTASGYRRDAVEMLAAIAKPLAAIELADLQRYADQLSRFAPATRRRKLAASRSLFRYAHDMGVIRENPAARLRLGSAPRLAVERILTSEQVNRLIGAEPDPRRRALVRLLYVCGLRASEAAGLRYRDTTSRPKGAAELAILGKGGKSRTVAVPAALWRDISALSSSPRPDAPVIANRDGGPLTRAAVHRIVKRAAKRIGLPAISAHWLRHAHVSHALDRGAPVHLVQKTVGHADLRTTTLYSHIRPGESSSAYLDEP